MKSFKANHLLYVGLFLLFLAISLISLLISMDSPWFTLVTSFGCGGLASVFVAWLVDMAICKINNNKAKLYQKEIISELISSFETGIQPFIFECELLDKRCKQQSKTWNEWIEVSHSLFKNKEDFVYKYVVFERDISEKIKVLNYQRAQLRQDGIMDENDCKAIGQIKSWCSLVETEFETYGATEAFLYNFDALIKTLYLYLNGSSAMNVINTIKIKSILE